jgi:anti-sigma regulatory factor (Ser/Thr protein kinase)
MEDLSLHILDIAENAVRADARLVQIRVRVEEATDTLTLEVRDDGCGMDEAMRERALSPFGTTRTERDVGLGLPLLIQAARETGGDCTVHSEPGRGTRVVATFRRSHIDCKPLGDLASSIRSLAMGNPGVDFVLELDENDEVQRFDTRSLGETADHVASEINSGTSRTPLDEVKRSTDPRYAEHHDGGHS